LLWSRIYNFIPVVVVNHCVCVARGVDRLGEILKGQITAMKEFSKVSRDRQIALHKVDYPRYAEEEYHFTGVGGYRVEVYVKQLASTLT